MTVAEFFGDKAFVVRPGYLFDDKTVVAYMRPKPILLVSAALLSYIEKEVAEGGRIEFLRTLEITQSKNLTETIDEMAKQAK